MTTLAGRLEGRVPRVLLTLGSGLGELADEVANPLVLQFTDIDLPAPTVPGHAGRLVVGDLHGVCVAVQQGRLHLYEGVPVADVAACVRAVAEAGAETFIVTNAAGGLAEDMEPGDTMVLADHLNLTGHSPLIRAGAHPQFVDMTEAYDGQLRRVALEAAGRLGVPAREGIYAGVVGPAYETPAETRLLRAVGADAVGMSTVTEVVAARALGLRVAGFSLITNVHRRGGTPTSHAEVLTAAEAGGPRLARLLREVLPHV
ncbi:MAG: purine-nucleoside phosphorylase [Nitriliruptorales bacterium]|nr:purine-nucleoside phosphorylase [Nitriliruptorales bacterium]